MERPDYVACQITYSYHLLLVKNIYLIALLLLLGHIIVEPLIVQEFQAPATVKP